MANNPVVTLLGRRDDLVRLGLVPTGSVARQPLYPTRVRIARSRPMRSGSWAQAGAVAAFSALSFRPSTGLQCWTKGTKLTLIQVPYPRGVRASVRSKRSEQHETGTPQVERGERLMTAFEQAPTGMALVGLGGEWLDVNQRLCAILGYEREALVGKTSRDITHPDDLHADRGQAQRLLAGELDAYSTEKRYVRKDGSIVQAKSAVSLVHGSSGKTLYLISGVEEATGRGPFERAREESEARFRFLVRNSSDIIALLKPDGSVAYVSPAMERVLGRDPQDRIGHSAFELMHPEDAEKARSLFREGISNPGVPLSVEVRMRHGDGTWRHMEVTGTNLIAEPIVEGIVVNTRDITERKQAVEELRAANEELKAFSYSVSHDLRAPLRSIEGFSQILLEDHWESLDEEGRDCLKRVTAASQNMYRLINDLLDLARVTSSELLRDRVDISALARDVSDGLLRADPAREVAFSIEEGLETRGDPRLLKIALENLLANAFKFTRKEKRAEIEVGFDADSGAYRISDNGAGFEMARAEKLFVPFGRLHHERDFDGTGIGLATVARIVRRHGGTIWAEGEPGTGAAFFFTLSA